MESFVNFLNGAIWGWGPAWSMFLVWLCLGAGLFFSFKTRFVQIRLFGEMWRLLFSGKESEHGISSFQALSVSLSGRVGTGNIAGVAAAIGFGGPGAVFWMWVVAFLGASTAYVESTLAQIYKEKVDGQYRGGPAYYFEKFFGNKIYGMIFAIATIISCGLFLPGVQANAISSAFVTAFGPGEIIQTTVFTDISTNKVIVLAAILLVLGFIIFGGIKRISHFAQIVVPFMALAYIIMACLIILLNITQLPHVIGLIIGDAFTPMAGVGAAIGWGVKRGVYSNEAGQGTGPHAAGAAEVQHPSQQGLVQSFSVYVDTLFVCSATAFMILITNSYNVQGALPEGQFIIQNLAKDIPLNTAALTQHAVGSVFSDAVGKPFVAVALLFFAFTTIMAYYYIAETNVAYIKRTLKIPGLMFIIKLVLMFAVAYGILNKPGYIWDMGDVGVGLMAWLNIVGILIIFFMAKPTMIALKDYEAQRKAGLEVYTFDPTKLGIKNATFWEDRIKENSRESNKK